MPSKTLAADQAASFSSSDHFLRACVLRLKLCIYLLDGESLPQNIVPSLKLLLGHVAFEDKPGKRRPDGTAETILAALQAQKQLCDLVTTSMIELEDSYCGRGRAIPYRRRTLDLLIVSMALTAELVTVYLQSPDDELRSLNLQAIQAKLKQVASALVKVRAYRKNSAKAAHRRARGGTSNPVEMFLARAKKYYSKMEPQVPADSIVAAEMRLVCLARNTVNMRDWPKGMSIDSSIDPLTKSLLADLWTVKRFDSRATSAVASEVAALMTSTSAAPRTENTVRAANGDARMLCESLAKRDSSHSPASAASQQFELLSGYAELIRDVLATDFQLEKVQQGQSRTVPDVSIEKRSEASWIAELQNGAMIVDMT